MGSRVVKNTGCLPSFASFPCAKDQRGSSDSGAGNTTGAGESRRAECGSPLRHDTKISVKEQGVLLSIIQTQDILKP